MKIEIHIDNIEIQDIIDTLKEQGVDVTRAEVESHIEDYIFGAVEDSKHERMDCIVDSLLDLQDWFLYTECMKNKARQFESTQEIEIFLAEKDNGTLDNLYENICDEWDGEEYIVEQFNIAIQNLSELISWLPVPTKALILNVWKITNQLTVQFKKTFQFGKDIITTSL